MTTIAARANPSRIRVSASELSMLLAWLAAGCLFLVGSLTISGFSSLPSIKSLLVLAAILGIAAAGQTLVIVLGGIDLSIAALMTLTDVMLPQLTSHGWSIATAITLAVALCTAIGATSGFVARSLSVHPLLITLGANFIVNGALLAWTGGAPTGSSPSWLTDLVSPARSLGPIPLPPVVAIWAVVAVVMLVLANRTTFGRRVYALGSSPSAAEYALVRPVRTWTIAFAISGFMAALAGLMLSGFTGYGDVNSGDPYLFDTVAAVVIGGTSLLGGRGGYFRTIAGSLALIEIQTLLVGYGIGPNPQQVALGLIIVGLALIYGRDRHIRYRI